MSGNVQFYLDDDSDDFEPEVTVKTKMKKEDRPQGSKTDLAKFHIQARNGAARRMKEFQERGIV